MKRALRHLGRAMAALAWRHWAWATGLAILVGVLVPIFYLDWNTYWVPDRIRYHTPWYIAFAYVFVFAIAWVESTDGDSAPGLRHYAAAALVAGALCVFVATALGPHIESAPRFEEEGIVRARWESDMTWETRRRINAASGVGFNAAFFGFLSTMIYARLRNARRMALSLSQAELARSEANRALVYARLAAARATVDPGQVIEQLGAIALKYESDAASADAQLDALIVMLRDAIPKLHERDGVRDKITA